MASSPWTCVNPEEIWDYGKPWKLTALENFLAFAFDRPGSDEYLVGLLCVEPSSAEKPTGLRAAGVDWVDLLMTSRRARLEDEGVWRNIWSSSWDKLAEDPRFTSGTTGLAAGQHRVTVSE